MSVFVERSRWVRRHPLAWVTLAFALVTVVLLFVWPGPLLPDGRASDTRLRAWALLLQLLGTITVLDDLVGRAKGAGHPGPARATVNWFREGLLGTRPIKGSVASLESTVFLTVGMSAHLKVTGKSVDRRIEILEEQVTQLEKSAGALRADLDATAKALRVELKQERQERQDQMDALQRVLRNAATDNFEALYLGALWVIVGTVLSTLSAEIVALIAGQGAAVWRSF